MDPLRIAIRAIFAFALALLLMRLSGKRIVKQGDPASFVVALVIGDMFDDFLWAEVSAAQFVVALGTLVGLHLVNAVTAARSGSREWLRERRG